jgi:hypothetical protein
MENYDYILNYTKLLVFDHLFQTANGFYTSFIFRVIYIYIYIYIYMCVCVCVCVCSVVNKLWPFCINDSTRPLVCQSVFISETTNASGNLPKRKAFAL